MDIKALALENEAPAIEMRRKLHRRPELSSFETETLAFIRERLGEYGIEYYEVEDGGILGYIGVGPEENTVLLRADVDALPIRENPRNLRRAREVISENDGVQHACGHDAHTAILLSAAKILKEHETELSGGRVLLLFERGEEGTGNLRHILRYLLEKKAKIAAAHALHVRPDLEAGKLQLLDGPVMAGATAFTVKIRGLGGHGSRPDLSNNPIDCFNAIYNALNAIRLRYVSPFDALTFSVGVLQSGDKANIIPSELTFGGSARFYKKDIGYRFAEEFRAILDGVTEAYHCSYELSGLKAGSPTVNNADAVALAREAVAGRLGAEVLADGEPLMGSESFSMIAQLWPSAFCFLGVENEELGAGAGLHSEYFDLDEAALKVGIAETVAFASEFLRRRPVFRHEAPADTNEVFAWLEASR